MNIVKPFIFICFMFFLSTPACIKNTVTVDYAGTPKTGDTTKIPAIILLKDTVKKGEPFVVTTSVQSPDTIVIWTINPSDNTSIVPNGNNATIFITLPGIYLITANFYLPTNTLKAYDSTNSTIFVNDSAYVPPDIELWIPFY